jgi:hypothetical protein
MIKNVPPPTEENLKKAYGKADENGKKLLADLYPAVFTPRPPMDWVDTFEKVCEAAGVDAAHYEVTASMSYKEKANKLMDQLMLLEVFNEGKPINRADTTQQKLYPYHRIIPDVSVSGGFRLAFAGSACSYDHAILGARPEFINKKISDFVGKTFCHIYEAWAQNFQLSKTNP